MPKKPPEPADLVAAVAVGRRAALDVLIVTLAETIQDTADRRAVAALAHQLRECLRERDSLPSTREASPLGNLTAARKARRSDATAVESA